jgi:hypothetical protein
MEKYPLHSDYVESYINKLILSNTSVSKDAQAFKNCVYLNPYSLTLTNCADRREKVDKYVSDNISVYNEIKSKINNNCKGELMEAFHLDKTLGNGREIITHDDRKNLSIRLFEKEKILRKCVGKLF